MEELSTTDVARITALSENTVRVRLHRARLFVRRELAGSRQTENSAARLAQPKRKARRQERPPSCHEMFAALSDYLDEKLDDSLCAELEKHMSGCAPCQAFIQDLKLTIREIKTYKSESLDRNAAAAIRRIILEKYEAAWKRKRSKAVAQP